MTNLFTSKDLGSLIEESPGKLMLSGELDYRNGKQLYLRGNEIINTSSANSFILDCSGVIRTSSVGLSLVLSLIRDCERVGKKLVISTLPVDLDEIAKFSGVIDILPLADGFKVIDVKNIAG